MVFWKFIVNKDLSKLYLLVSCLVEYREREMQNINQSGQNYLETLYAYYC